jgi:hypothetical protein
MPAAPSSPNFKSYLVTDRTLSREDLSTLQILTHIDSGLNFKPCGRRPLRLAYVSRNSRGVEYKDVDLFPKIEDLLT